jgi:hypothetical protein
MLFHKIVFGCNEHGSQETAKFRPSLKIICCACNRKEVDMFEYSVAGSEEPIWGIPMGF